MCELYQHLFNVIKNTSWLKSLVFHSKSWGGFDVQEDLPYASKFPWLYHVFMEIEVLWFEKSDWVQILLLEFHDTPHIALIDFYKLSSVNSLHESYIPARLLVCELIHIQAHLSSPAFLSLFMT